MMLLGLALLAQAGDLPANTADAARLCGSAALRGPGSPSDRALQVGFFTLLSARERKTGGRFAEALSAEAQAVAEGAANADPALLTACRQRFPLGWATRVTLPADSFDRRLVCVVSTGFVLGVFGQTRDTALTQRYTPVYNRFVGLIPDSEFGDRGLTTEEQLTGVADKWLAAIPDLGNPLAIVTSCEAAFPA